MSSELSNSAQLGSGEVTRTRHASWGWHMRGFGRLRGCGLGSVVRAVQWEEGWVGAELRKHSCAGLRSWHFIEK